MLHYEESLEGGLPWPLSLSGIIDTVQVPFSYKEFRILRKKGGNERFRDEIWCETIPLKKEKPLCSVHIYYADEEWLSLLNISY